MKTAAALRIAAVNGSYSTGGKTDGLIAEILSELTRQAGAQFGRTVDAQVIEISELGSGLTAALSRDSLSSEVLEQMAAVEHVDLVIAATAVHRGSYTGLFKHFFDLTDQHAFANRPVILAATAGSDRHTLMIEHTLRPLFGFLHAHVAPVGVYASSGDFAGGVLLNPEIRARIELAVRDILPEVVRQTEQSSAQTTADENQTLTV